MEKDKEDQIIPAGGIKVTISGGVLPPRSIIMLKSFIRRIIFNKTKFIYFIEVKKK